MGALPKRDDPNGLTWEPAALVGSMWIVGTGLGLLAARMCSAWLSGQGWIPPTDTLDAIWGVISGRLELGFPDGSTPPTVLVAIHAVAIEIALVVSLGLGWRWLAPYMGVGLRRGLATASQAKRVLGVGRLRRGRFEIRPDLYAKRYSRRSS